MSKVILNFLSRRVLSRSAILVLDLLMIVFSCLSMYLVMFGFSGLTPEVRGDGTTLCLLLVFFNTITFISFRTFSGILRFSSFTDLLRITYALVFGDVLVYLAVKVLKKYNPDFHITDITFIAIFFLNMFLMIFSRILVKEVYEAITGSGVKPINVFIYGTKEAGISVAKALRGNSEFNYRVLGLISDESHMVGKELMGCVIHANNENLFSLNYSYTILFR